MGPLRIPSIPRSARKISILEESIDATRSRKDPGLEIDESLGDESAAALQICLPGYAISEAFVGSALDSIHQNHLGREGLRWNI